MPFWEEWRPGSAYCLGTGESILSRKEIVMLCSGFLVWVIWCVFVVLELVPVVQRRLTIYPQFAAWVLCILPPLAAAVVLLVRITGESEEA